MREAEFAEMDFKYRQELQTSSEKIMEKDQTIRQLKQDLFQHKSLPKQVQSVREMLVSRRC